MNAWEIHPAIVHFPIALLLSAVVVDLFALWRKRVDLNRTIQGLLLFGSITGVFAVLSGLLAYYTVPAHTAEAHEKMIWHLWVQISAILLFSIVTALRWNAGIGTRRVISRWVGLFAAFLLVFGSLLGGVLVYHGGAGVDPAILAPEVREGHHHGEHGHSSGHGEHDQGTSEDDHQQHDHEGHAH